MVRNGIEVLEDGVVVSGKSITVRRLEGGQGVRGVSSRGYVVRVAVFSSVKGVDSVFQRPGHCFVEEELAL